MALGITCDAPPTAVIGSVYSHFFPALDDTPPDVFTITVGTLPDGLSLDAATGEVSGAPLGPVGTSTFTIQVEDSTLATAEVECSIDVVDVLDIGCANPPAGKVNLPYSHTLFAFGGVLPYAFAITAGSLPPGLSLGALTGTISGTPTTSGTFTFTCQITDGDDVTDSVACSIIIKTCLVDTP